MDIFEKPADFAAFIKLLEEGRRRFDMRILGYCLMHNHWHLVLWPRRGGDLSRFIGWVSTTHVRRWREHRGTSGQGHLYQGRFKSFAVQTDGHLLAVLRYVEGNPLRAKMVKRAQDWPWSSLGSGAGSDGVRLQLSPWPVDRPTNWSRMVNEAMGAGALERLRTSVVRGRPFGSDAWVTRTVARLGLEWTVRDPWRPHKKAPVGVRKVPPPGSAKRAE
jgi:putative transposase